MHRSDQIIEGHLQFTKKAWIIMCSFLLRHDLIETYRWYFYFLKCGFEELENSQAFPREKDKHSLDYLRLRGAVI